jgi:hypothetical protein
VWLLHPTDPTNHPTDPTTHPTNPTNGPTDPTNHPTDLACSLCVPPALRGDNVLGALRNVKDVMRYNLKKLENGLTCGDIHVYRIT